MQTSVYTINATEKASHDATIQVTGRFVKANDPSLSQKQKEAANRAGLGRGLSLRLHDGDIVRFYGTDDILLDFSFKPKGKDSKDVTAMVYLSAKVWRGGDLNSSTIKDIPMWLLSQTSDSVRDILENDPGSVNEISCDRLVNDLQVAALVADKLFEVHVHEDTKTSHRNGEEHSWNCVAQLFFPIEEEQPEKVEDSSKDESTSAAE